MSEETTPSRPPIMTLLDALGRRWTLRILWELRGSALSFRALRAASDNVSPSVLNARLAELREMGVVGTDDDGYTLTPSGRELAESLLVLNDWAKRYI